MCLFSFPLDRDQKQENYSAGVVKITGIQINANGYIFKESHEKKGIKVYYKFL
jgi:hypothetical protein